jgi:diguanylate cyclase (GGDEF)-like protein
MFNKILNFWLKFAASGTTETTPKDELRKAQLLNSMSLTGFIIIIGFMTWSYLEGYFIHASILAGISSLVVINLIALRFSHNLDVAIGVILFLMATLLIWLLISGGEAHSRVLWFYVYSPLVLFLTGSKKGSIIVLGFLTLQTGLLYIPYIEVFLVEYSHAFKIRLILSQFAVYLLVLYYEISRKQAFEALKKLSSKLNEIAQTDPLTGLLNRRGMIPLLQNHFEIAKRSKEPFSLFILDIDHFKKFNDRFGHECGDMILKFISDQLRSGLRAQDAICRWGGEEILILLPNTNSKGAGLVGFKMRQFIEKSTLEYNDMKLGVTVSVGVSTWDETFKNIDELISKADANLYKAKESGRNTTVV